MFDVQSDTKQNGRRYFNNTWRHTGESPESSHRFGFVSDCSDRHFSRQKFTEMQSGKRRFNYEPTPEEVKYWASIHKLNEQKTDPKPAPVYIVTTVELIQAEVCDGL
jgi:hypothetical protein